jgi:hypothetical protein
MTTKIQAYAKFIAAILTVIVTAGAGLIPVGWIGWVQLVVAVLGAVAVYAIPNAAPVAPVEVDPTPSTAAPQHAVTPDV